MTYISQTILHRLWTALLLAVLLLPAMPGEAAPSASPQSAPGTGRKVLVDTNDLPALDWLNSSGATRLALYDSFSLWLMPDVSSSSLQAEVAFDWQPLDDTIFLRGQALDPGLVKSLPASGVPADPGLAFSGSPGFWMVQFIGPLQDAWLDALRAAGLEPAAYLPNFAYVVWGQQPDLRLADLSARWPFIQWIGPYQPAYRLAPDLAGLPSGDGSPQWADVTVQIYPHSQAAQTLTNLLALAETVIQPPYTLAGWTTLSLRLPVSRLAELAGWPDVFNIESWQAPDMLDEAQGQLLAGNITRLNGKTGPSGPGYLEWLNSLGFPTDPNRYPIVDITDDGIDSGSASAILHPDFYQYGLMPGSDRVTYLNNCTTDPSANGLNGHGNLNAGIMGGYNNRSGNAYEDNFGYQYGLGISPYGRIAGTKIFRNDGFFDLSGCAGLYTGILAASVAGGASITSNSWGNNAPGTLGLYNAAAQAYDSLTRDASLLLAGNQPMLHIFSAGNKGGSGSYTITPPGTAKNVLTVGAAENTRDPLKPDACGHTDADSGDDIAAFSSRGPLFDGRSKPDLVAPGVHVQGPASQTPGYTGATVCGNDGGYNPPGQKLYTWSSGTSHAAPAVAGAAQLAYEYYNRVLNPGSQPSPAMLKALLINAARYLNGVSAGDSLPSPNQGWGSANLGKIFDGSARYIIDQTHLFSASGSELSIVGGVVNPDLPLRVSLVWTDAPGATTGSAYVNNLDLEVSVGGQTYKGNVFNGAFSTPGGAFDPANNVENVFLPAGLQGSFQVRVIARNIGGDGLPGNTDLTDQDFALVIANGQTGLAPIFSIQNVRWSDTGGQIPGVIEPGESVDLYLDLTNQGNLLASGIKSSLKLTSGKATLATANSAYPDIPPGAAASNTNPFRLVVNSGQTCGAALQFTQVVRYYPARQVNLAVSLPVGFLWTSSFSASDLPQNITDLPGSPAAARLAVTPQITPQNVSVHVSISHPRVSDLTLRLLPPGYPAAGSPAITLSDANGGAGANYQQTLFDDQASQSISQGSAPFTGSFRPQQALSALNGKPAEGNWQLQVTNQVSGVSGQVTQFVVSLRFASCDPALYQVIKRIYLPFAQR